MPYAFVGQVFSSSHLLFLSIQTSCVALSSFYMASPRIGLALDFEFCRNLLTC